MRWHRLRAVDRRGRARLRREPNLRSGAPLHLVGSRADLRCRSAGAGGRRRRVSDRPARRLFPDRRQRRRHPRRAGGVFGIRRGTAREIPDHRAVGQLRRSVDPTPVPGGRLRRPLSETADVREPWVFGVGPESRFYSPFWQVYGFEVPDGVSAESLLDTRAVIAAANQTGGFRTLERRMVTAAPKTVFPANAWNELTYYDDSAAWDGQGGERYIDLGPGRFQYDEQGVVTEVPLFVFTKDGVMLDDWPHVGGTRPLFFGAPPLGGFGAGGAAGSMAGATIPSIRPRNRPHVWRVVAGLHRRPPARRGSGSRWPRAVAPGVWPGGGRVCALGFAGRSKRWAPNKCTTPSCWRPVRCSSWGRSSSRGTPWPPTQPRSDRERCCGEADVVFGLAGPVDCGVFGRRVRGVGRGARRAGRVHRSRVDADNDSSGYTPPASAGASPTGQALNLNGYVDVGLRQGRGTAPAFPRRHPRPRRLRRRHLRARGQQPRRRRLDRFAGCS